MAFFCNRYPIYRKRAFLHTVVTKEPSACHLVTVHNIAHQVITRLSNVFPSQTLLPSRIIHFWVFVTKRIGLQPLWINCLSFSAAIDEEVAPVNCWRQVEFMWMDDIFLLLLSRFPAFVQDFFNKLFPNLDSPAWAREALASVGVVLPSWLIFCTCAFLTCLVGHLHYCLLMLA